MSPRERERGGFGLKFPLSLLSLCLSLSPPLNLLSWRLGLGFLRCNRLIRLNYCAPMTSQTTTTTMMMVGSQLALSLG